MAAPHANKIAMTGSAKLSTLNNSWIIWNMTIDKPPYCRRVSAPVNAFKDPAPPKVGIVGRPAWNILSTICIRMLLAARYSDVAATMTICIIFTGITGAKSMAPSRLNKLCIPLISIAIPSAANATVSILYSIALSIDATFIGVPILGVFRWHATAIITMAIATHIMPHVSPRQISVGVAGNILRWHILSTSLRSLLVTLHAPLPFSNLYPLLRLGPRPSWSAKPLPPLFASALPFFAKIRPFSCPNGETDANFEAHRAGEIP